jgi:RNA polymerase sigma-70 factor (ECF subfamily)
MNERHERFGSMYARYRRSVINFFVRGFHVGEEDAKDLTQETFTRFYEALDEYRGDAKWAYLEMIARRVGINHVRSLSTAKRRAKMVNIDDQETFTAELVAQEGPDYAEREHLELRLTALRDAIASLPPGQRQCVQLLLTDMKYHEIAKALRISLDAVRSRIRDAKRLLRERLGATVALPEDDE